MFRGLPGERHIRKGWYRLYVDIHAHEPQHLTKESWQYLVNPGCHVLLAFVVGTWQMSCINFCPNCGKRNAGGWRTWQRCSCSSLYYVSEAGEVNYEPRDGFWDGESKDLATDWNIPELPKQKTADMHSKEESTESDPDRTQDDSSATGDSERIESYYSHELYFRCMVMVYDPIFNFACRNVFCRCILGLVSFTSKAPRIDIPSMIPCPRHTRRGVPECHEVLRAKFNYHRDPYFDKFGGYDHFLQIARYVNESTIAVAFIDVEKIYPEEALNHEMVDELIHEHKDAVWSYWEEMMEKLEICWSTRMKAQYTSQDPAFVAYVNDWLADQRDDLAKYRSKYANGSSSQERPRAILHEDNFKLPYLSKGRLTYEHPQDAALLQSGICVRS